jgi:hypothetical protein
MAQTQTAMHVDMHRARLAERDAVEKGAMHGLCEESNSLYDEAEDYL